MNVDNTTHGYTPPVSALLTLGGPKGHRQVEKWPDYVAEYGFTTEQIPELGRLALDSTLWGEEYWERPEVNACIHAYRALGQLRDAAALPYLIEIIETEEESDWILEEIGYAFALIGPTAIPLLKESLERHRNRLFTGLTIVDCLEKIGLAHPEARDECVAVLTEQLESAEENDSGINGSIVSTLVMDFKAIESLPIIEKAFAGDFVDEMVMGDWDDVQVEFGLKASDFDRPRRPNPLMEKLRIINPDLEEAKRINALRKAERRAKTKKKAKRKQAKKQKKQQRKRKK